MTVMSVGSMSWRLLSGAVVLLLVGLLAASIIDDVRFASERIGVYIGENDDGVTVEAVEPGLPADLAGAQPGDVIKSVNQEPTPDPYSLSEAFDRFHQPGQSLDVVVLRDGAEVEMSVTPGAPPDLARLLVQLVLVAAYFGLALLAAQHRNEDLRARLLMIFVALVAIEMALPAGVSFGTAAALLIGLSWVVMTGAQIAIELHLVSLIPRRLPLLKRYPWVVKAFYVLGFVIIAGLMALTFHAWRLSGDFYSETLYQVQDMVLIGWAIVVPAILVWQAWKARTARQRNQAMLVLIGLVPWIIYIFLSTFWAGWTDVDIRWAIHAENFVLLFFPAAVFVAIFRYGLFDVEQLVRRGLVYSVVTTLIIILLYMLLTTALSWFTDTLGEDVGLWLVTGIAVVSGILFRPLRHGIERLVERGLFPERRALRNRLIEIAGSLSDDQSNMHEMLNRLASQAQDTLGLGWTAVVAI